MKSVYSAAPDAKGLECSSRNFAVRAGFFRAARGCGTRLVTSLGLLLVCAALQPAIASQKALLIGAGQYPYLAAKWSLAGPSKDVQSMSDFLVDQWGFSDADVRIIQDRDATKRGILDGIGTWLPSVTKAGDRIVIYFSGHGTQVDDISGDEQDGKDEAFVPTDFGRDPKCAKVAFADRAECARQMILDDELAIALENLRDRVVIVIADSCNSGTVTKTLRLDSLNAKARYFPFPTSSKGLTRPEEPISKEIDVQLTISAALPHQLAWESGGSGIFTRHFIDALTDMSADVGENGTVSTAELINYVKSKTEKWCLKHSECRDMKLGFTPNIDPKNETFVLQPFFDGGLQTVTENDIGAISDILPEFRSDTISIDILPWRRLTEGEKVKIRVTSARDGHLTLFDFNSDDQLTLLFPTQSDMKSGKSDEIQANRPLTIPNEFHKTPIIAGEPFGPGRAIAIVTRDRVDFGPLLDRHRNFNPVGDKVRFMKSISAHLYDVWTEGDENRGVQWAVAYAGYEIVAR